MFSHKFFIVLFVMSPFPSKSAEGIINFIIAESNCSLTILIILSKPLKENPNPNEPKIGTPSSEYSIKSFIVCVVGL